MKKNNRKEIENDLWFASQMEILRQMEPNRHVDVTDAVMEKVQQLPATKVQPYRQRIWAIASGAVAACLVGVIITTSILSHNKLRVSNDNQDLYARFYEVYEYCNDYADEESIEDASYYENPVSQLY